MHTKGKQLKNLFQFEEVSCRSTYFTRTIQSAIHLMHGLQVKKDKILVDTRNWRSMIPDGDVAAYRQLIKKFATPSPLSPTDEQFRAELTKKVFKLGVFAFERGPDAGEEYGVGLDRLTETLLCLQHYDRLPPSVTSEEVKRIFTQMANVHFAKHQHPLLLQNTMGPFVQQLLEPLRDPQSLGEGGPRLRIYSAHDSTLCGLIQAFALRPIAQHKQLCPDDEPRPADNAEGKQEKTEEVVANGKHEENGLEGKDEWHTSMFPAYADALRIELLERTELTGGVLHDVSICSEVLDPNDRYFVRFVYDGHGPVGIDGHLVLPTRLVKAVWEASP
jgi:hypothetical protein